ncbi:MAG: hypothetical protein M1812_000591 [Candelaria pacifica]|nr:MAG: hypothetical protein M1812_000591 [Candelaria pacifica]
MLLQTLSITLSIAVTARATLTVPIKPGNVNGIQCPSSEVNSFLGIPYAQPPTGNLRFASPAPYNGSFAGANLNATKLASACIQFDSSFAAPGPYSEDCLYLNVWAPANATSHSKIPVKTFIHGGGARAGGITDPLYNGCNLATDAIVVTLAYRLGPLGFLSIENAGIPGNMGLQDLMLGLQWIQDNVAAFGGDPKKVLVFGESAGAELAWILSTLSDAPAKMKAALSESGAGTILPSNKQYEPLGQGYADSLGCNASDIACFRSKSSQELMGANPSSSSISLVTAINWSPFVDGRIINKQPASVSSKVPFLAGTNSMEGTLFVLSAYNSPQNVTAHDFYAAFQGFGDYVVQIKDRYTLAQYNSTGYAPFYALSQILTDAGYKCPTRRALNVTSNANMPAYTYLSSHVPSCSWEQSIPAQALRILGATHSSELPFVFRQLTSLPLTNGTCSLNSQEKSISSVLSAAWTSMAEGGFPGSVSNGGGLWPTFNISASQGLTITNSTAASRIDYTNCDLWDSIARLQLANATSTATNGTASPRVSPNPTSSADRVNLPFISLHHVYATFLAIMFFGMI